MKKIMTIALLSLLNLHAVDMPKDDLNEKQVE